MKYLLIILAALSLSSCGYIKRQLAVLTDYSEVCVDGVTYLQFSSGATPKYTIDGKLVPCK